MANYGTFIHRSRYIPKPSLWDQGAGLPGGTLRTYENFDTYPQRHPLDFSGYSSEPMQSDPRWGKRVTYRPSVYATSEEWEDAKKTAAVQTEYARKQRIAELNADAQRRALPEQKRQQYHADLMKYQGYGTDAPSGGKPQTPYTFSAPAAAGQPAMYDTNVQPPVPRPAPIRPAAPAPTYNPAQPVGEVTGALISGGVATQPARAPRQSPAQGKKQADAAVKFTAKQPGKTTEEKVSNATREIMGGNRQSVRKPSPRGSGTMIGVSRPESGSSMRSYRARLPNVAYPKQRKPQTPAVGGEYGVGSGPALRGRINRAREAIDREEADFRNPPINIGGRPIPPDDTGEVVEYVRRAAAQPVDNSIRIPPEMIKAAIYMAKRAGFKLDMRQIRSVAASLMRNMQQGQGMPGITRGHSSAPNVFGPKMEGVRWRP